MKVVKTKNEVSYDAIRPNKKAVLCFAIIKGGLLPDMQKGEIDVKVSTFVLGKRLETVHTLENESNAEDITETLVEIDVLRKLSLPTFGGVFSSEDVQEVFEYLVASGQIDTSENLSKVYNDVVTYGIMQKMILDVDIAYKAEDLEIYELKKG